MVHFGFELCECSQATIVLVYRISCRLHDLWDISASSTPVWAGLSREKEEVNHIRPILRNIYIIKFHENISIWLSVCSSRGRILKTFQVASWYRRLVSVIGVLLWTVSVVQLSFLLWLVGGSVESCSWRIVRCVRSRVKTTHHQSVLRPALSCPVLTLVLVVKLRGRTPPTLQYNVGTLGLTTRLGNGTEYGSVFLSKKFEHDRGMYSFKLEGPDQGEHCAYWIQRLWLIIFYWQ